jgi:putative colanic acid biosynthesis acetyltransferase WcaF
MKYKLYKALWMIVWTMFVRPFPRISGNKVAIFLLRLFGAQIGKGCRIYSSAKILVPYNLVLGDNVILADRLLIQNTALIEIKSNSIISQGTYLCAGSHDIYKETFDTIRKHIFIGENVWVAAECFVGPGVKIGDGAVAGARSCIFKDVEAWTLVGGNPAKTIKKLPYIKCRKA